MAETKARNKANAKYAANNYDRLNTYFLKGKKEVYTQLAADKGYSKLGTFLEDLLDAEAAAAGYKDKIKELNGGELTRNRKETAF